MREKKFIITSGRNPAASAIVPANTTVTLISIDVSPGELFKLSHFANYAEVEAWGSMAWKILRNGSQVPGTEEMTDQYGDPSTPFEFGVEIIGRGGDNISIIVINRSLTTAYDAGALIKGGFGRYADS